jgi:hypothetical protein
VPAKDQLLKQIPLAGGVKSAPFMMDYDRMSPEFEAEYVIADNPRLRTGVLIQQLKRARQQEADIVARMEWEEAPKQDVILMRHYL